MGYFPVDDILLSHWRAKVAGPAGVGLWTMGGLYCNTQLTDGHIPRLVAENLLPNAKPAVKKVLESGLWETCMEHEQCYVMRAYHSDSSGGQRQPTRAEVERRRTVAREKKREQRRGLAGQYAPPTEFVPSRPAGVPRGHKGDTADVSPSNSSPYSTPLHTFEGQKHAQPQSRPSVRVTTEMFDQFWQAYPRKVGKQEARRFFETAAKRVGPEVVIEGAVRYSKDPNLSELRFIPHPSTWLNRGGWDDEPLPSRGSEQTEQQKQDVKQRMAELDRIEQEKK